MKVETPQDIIKSIYESSNAKFGCNNYQFIAESLAQELKNNFIAIKPKRKSYLGAEIKLRNLDILTDVINGARYKDLRLKYGLQSTAAIQIIAKKTACNLSNLIKREMTLVPPKRIIKQYSAHILGLIKQRKEKLNKEVNNVPA